MATDMGDRTHVMTIRVTELTFGILQAKESGGASPPASQAADLLEDWADKERHVSNLIQRAIDSQQAGLAGRKP